VLPVPQQGRSRRDIDLEVFMDEGDN
jgi:hypothetical protein